MLFIPRLLLVLSPLYVFFFFFIVTPATVFYTLSLHDALPIWLLVGIPLFIAAMFYVPMAQVHQAVTGEDRKSTRLNSSHVAISYAVFCLKKKIVARRPLHQRFQIRFNTAFENRSTVGHHLDWL